MSTITDQGSMTEPQHDYLLDLLGKKDIGDAETAVQQRVVGWQVSKKLASEWIQRLKDAPYKNRNGRTAEAEEWSVVDVKTFEQMGQPSSPGEELWAMHRRVSHDCEDGTGDDLIVPRGSYALHTVHPHATNDIAFYSVWISDDGSRWSVKMYRSDERCKIQRSAQYMVLNRIAEDPPAAAALYGHEVGKCGICGRKLTNDESREFGIGPICRAKWGW